MTITPRLYIGGYDVARGVAFGYEHSYLYFDPDSDNDQDPTTGSGMQIIRGGPDFGDGSITVEVGVNASDSIDAFDEGAPWGVRSPEDRNFRVLLEGSGASTAWTAMKQFAATLGAPHPTEVDLYVTPFDYEALGPNSNSVINSVLNSVNLDFRVSTPYLNGTTIPNNPIEFPAHLNFLDGNGDDSFLLHAYSGVDGGYKIHDNVGNDLFIIEYGAKASLSRTDGVSNGDDNLVALRDYKLASLSLQTSVNDLIVRMAGATLLDSPVYVFGQYDSSAPLLLTRLKVTGAGGSTIKDINLAAISESEAFGNLSVIYTAFDSSAVTDGHIVKGSSITAQVDRIYGLDGQDDVLTGDRGNDILRGGTGIDSYKWNLGDGSDTIVDTWGTGEKLSFGSGITREMLSIDDVGSDLVLTITNAAGTAYSGTITLKDAASLESTFIANHIDNIIHESDPATSTYLWGTYDEVLEEYFDDEDVIDGSDGVNDHIEGQNHDDILSGLSGDDFIEGGAGKNDVLNGGAGNDRLEDYDGGTLNGGGGNDTLIGGYNATMHGAGSTTLNGGSGNDIISAVGNGTFSINGGDDHDIISVMHADAVATVNGGAGNDTLYLRNDSTVVASAGDDIVFHAWGQGSQTTIQFDVTWTLGTDITVAFSQNGRDLIVTHPDGTIMLVDFKDRPASWLGKIGSAGTPFNFSDIELSYVYTGTENIVFGSSQELNVAAITTAAGNDSIDLNIDTDDVTIATGAGQDAVTVYGDNITINTGDDIDAIDSSYGDHAIIAGSGADTITIYQSRGTLDAGSGDDVVTANMLTGDNFDIDLGAGNDRIKLDFGDATIDGGDGDDYFDLTLAGIVIAHGDAGNDVFMATNAEVHGGDGDDTMTGALAYGDGGNDTITGLSGDDILRGGAGLDIIAGGTGNDDIAGGDDADTIHGDDDNDLVNGDAGNDTLYGDAGNDTINGGTGGDTINGGAQSDTIHGNDGNDILVGGGGDDVLTGDTIYGDDGDDTITATSGRNNLYGGLGIDTITGGDDGNTIEGNDGNDILTGGTGADGIYGGAGDDTIAGGAGGGTLDGGDGIDTITGGAGSDTVNGGAGVDTIYTYGGVDGISAGDGDDLVYAGAGNDTVHGDAGADTIYGEDGSDIVEGETGNDIIYGGIGADQLRGEDDNDTLYGEADDDTLIGGAGNDVLDGGAGSDFMIGGVGNDTYYVDAMFDGTIENTNEGTDIVYASINYTLESNVENLQLTGTTGRTGTGNALNNNITGTIAADTLSGGDGNDFLSGGNGVDTIAGGLGNDTLLGGIGDDILNGGDGNDTFHGGQGEDIMVGGAGDDTYYADSITETITENAGEGIDTVVTTKNLYTLGANVENLTFLIGMSGFQGSGNALDNVITGNVGNDNLSGMDGNDTLNGAGGGDILTGGDGNDTINGGADNDTLNMGLGTDTVSGGSGADIFAFETGCLGSGTDTVCDFSIADSDQLDLSNLLESYDPMTQAIADFVSYSVSGGDTTISVDTAGTGSSYTALATLTGVTLTGTVADLVTNGQLQVE